MLGPGTEFLLNPPSGLVVQPSLVVRAPNVVGPCGDLRVDVGQSFGGDYTDQEEQTSFLIYLNRIRPDNGTSSVSLGTHSCDPAS